MQTLMDSVVKGQIFISVQRCYVVCCLDIKHSAMSRIASPMLNPYTSTVLCVFHRLYSIFHSSAHAHALAYCAQCLNVCVQCFLNITQPMIVTIRITGFIAVLFVFVAEALLLSTCFMDFQQKKTLERKPLKYETVVCVCTLKL